MAGRSGGPSSTLSFFTPWTSEYGGQRERRGSNISLSSFVGALGIGPKYLLDEYAILDSRYWEKDNTVMWVSYLEFFTMAPLSYMW